MRYKGYDRNQKDDLHDFADLYELLGVKEPNWLFILRFVCMLVYVQESKNQSVAASFHLKIKIGAQNAASIFFYLGQKRKKIQNHFPFKTWKSQFVSRVNWNQRDFWFKENLYKNRNIFFFKSWKNHNICDVINFEKWLIYQPRKNNQ